MFREMRRFKQLLPQETAIEILNRNTSGTLALIGDNDYPYAVPISYVYIMENCISILLKADTKLMQLLNMKKHLFA